MTNPSVFAMPLMGRYGLTHGLLAWARCRLWCEQNDVVMLAPFWLKPRVGPYLRRERDKRNYFLLFHHDRAISGIRRLAILAHSKKIEVGPEWPSLPASMARTTLFRFHNAAKDNERKSFAQIVGEGPYLRRELMQITRPRFHPQVPANPFIAIHVRMGDFTPQRADGQIAGASNSRLPIEWYGDRLNELRSKLGRVVPAIVFSDGSDAEITPLLNITGVQRARQQQSITDLLQIGLGAAVIASGSGFSLWGAFLGSAPRIAHPGQSIVPIDNDRSRDIESGFGESIGPRFLDQVRIRLGDLK